MKTFFFTGKRGKTWKRSALVFLTFLVTTAAQAQLSGTYTINGTLAASSTNYKTFASAVSDLVSGTRADGGTANGSGVSGAVTFNVADGTYTEQISIAAITGASSTNTITFKSASGDSTKVTLRFATTSTNNYVVQLNGVDYITFKQMTLTTTATTTSNSRVVELKSNAHFNTFSACRIIGYKGTSAVTSSALVYSPSDKDTNNTFSGNYFKYGGYGLYLLGSSTNAERGLTVKNNSFDSVYSTNIYLDYPIDPAVTGNYFTGVVSTTGHGLQMNNLTGGATITKNNFNYNDNSWYVIYVNTGTGSSTKRALIANNFIRLAGTSSSSVGIHLNNAKYFDVLHNNVSFPNTASSSRPLYVNSSSTATPGFNRIFNNIFANTGGGVAVEVSANAVATDQVDTMDYNDIYATGTNLAKWGSTSYTTLAAWRTASKQGPNSISAAPGFTSSTDLHISPFSVAVNNKASTYLTVTDDIDGQTRSATTPDIGADEYTPYSVDAGLMSIVSPVIPVCNGSTPNVTVNILNRGTDQMDSITINYMIDGVLQASAKYIFALASGRDTNLVIGTIGVTSSTKSLKIYLSKVNGISDDVRSDDTISKSVQGALSGTYTIGAGQTYTSLTAAVNDLKARGVCGAVTFSIADGTYTEQISIPQIAGASSTNTITFKSASGDSTKVKVGFATTSANNYVVQLDGADYITLRQMTLTTTATTTSNSRVVEIKSGANSNAFSGCRIIGYKGTSSGTATALVYSTTDKDTSNTFTGNYFKYGSYALYLQGTSTNTERGIVVSNNIFDSMYYTNVYLEYSIAPTVTGNYFSGVVSTSGNGIQLSTTTEGATITKNTINFSANSNYLVYVTGGAGTSASRGLITNNFIRLAGTSGSCAGIYLNNVKYFDVIYNSVYFQNTSTTSRALYVNSSSTATAGFNRIFNNIFANTGGGYAVEVATSATTTDQIDTMDYNVLYATGTNLAKWGATSVTTLADWRTASKQDANSISDDPEFRSATNLHISPVGNNVNNKASTYLTVTDDIDGQARSAATPDIGADEFTPVSIDIALTGLSSPEPGTCDATTDLTVNILNRAADQLDSITVTYLLNGVQQSSTKYTFTLTTGNDTNLVIGTIAVSSIPKAVKIYISKMNGFADGIRTNDTLSLTVQNGMSGTYTIGAGQNYTTFTDAVAALKTRGVCGPVTFNVADGNYTEQISIPQISGSSAANTITFKSASGDSSKVSLRYGTSTADNNYTIQLNGADYITFSNMTIERTGSTTYTKLVELTNGAHQNTFKNNRFMGIKASSYATDNALIHVTAVDRDTNNTVMNNYMKFGSASIYYDGTNTGTEPGLLFQGNTIDSAYGDVLYLYYLERPVVKDNTITNVLGTSSYNIEIDYASNGAIVTGNKIYNALGTYGIRIYYSTASSSNPGLVANNMVALKGTSASSGIYFYYSTNYNFYYNSVLNTSTSTTARALYIDGTSTTNGQGKFINNIFANTGGGVAVEVTSGAVSGSMVNTSDYNDLYATGTNLGKWNGTSYTSLSAYKTTSSQEANSISADPKYVSSSNLHLQKSAIKLNNKGQALTAVNTDIDNETRSATTPDIGADEFTPNANDIKLNAFIAPANNACGDSFMRVGVSLYNAGTSSQSSFNIGASVSGSTTASLSRSFPRTIASDATDTMYFITTLNTYAGGTYTIKAYAGLSGDADRTNDTITSTFTINAIPAGPVVTSASRCGNGDLNLIAKGGSGMGITWYNTGGAAVSTGDTLKLKNIGNTASYYAATYSYKAASLTTLFTGTTSTFTGNMFDLKSNVSTTVDSFDINTTGTGSVDVSVYYRVGTYVGNEATSSAWTLLGTTTVTGKGTGNATTIKPGKLNLTANQVYGIYIAVTSGGNIVYTSLTTGTTYSNADLSLTVGAGLNGLFTSALSPRAWNGRVYYSVKGCESQRIPVKATINRSPNASFKKGSTYNGTFAAGTAASPDLVCPGSTITYELNPPSGFTNAEFGSKWVISSFSFATANGTAPKDTSTALPTATANASLTFTPVSNLADSTFIVSLKITDLVTGCDSSFNRYISVSRPPAASFTVSDACDGDAVAFVNISSASASAAYTWDFGDGNTSADKNPVHTYAAPGTYTVSMDINSGVGCTDAYSATVTVHPRTVPGFTVGDLCATHEAAFINTTTAPSQTVTYMWDFGDGITSIDENPVHTFAADGTYDVKLVSTNQFGCKDSITTTLTVRPTPTAKFGAENTCQDNVVSFIDSSSSGFSAPTYHYDFGDGTTSAQKNPTHLYSGSGTYVVKLVLTNAYGCADSTERTITVYPKPEAGFTNTTSCATHPIAFSDTSTIASGNITSYSWNFGDGTTSTDKNPLHTFSQQGLFFVSLKVTSDNGCTDSIRRNFYVNGNPVAGFTADPVCEGNVTEFTLTSAAPSYTYAWDFGDNSTSVDANPTHTYTAAGTYSVQLVVTNTNGCTDTMVSDVEVMPIPVADFSIASDVCEGNTASFTDLSSVSSGTIANYIWSFGDGATSTDKNPTHTYSQAGSFKVILGVSANGGCLDTVSKMITIFPRPEASFSGTDVCVGEATVFTNTSTTASGTITTYAWNFGDGSTSSDENPTHTYAAVGGYTVWLKVTNSNGCEDSTSVQVKVNALPTADFTYSINSKQVTFIPQDANLASYSWNFGDGTSSTSTAPVHNYSADGHYTVTLTVQNGNGCEATYSDTFTINTVGIREAAKPAFELNVYPNPFKHTATLSYSLPNAAAVKAVIFDISGKQVATLVDDIQQSAGAHSYTFNANDYNMQAGTYLVRILVDGTPVSKQIIRLK